MAIACLLGQQVAPQGHPAHGKAEFALQLAGEGQAQHGFAAAGGAFHHGRLRTYSQQINLLSGQVFLNSCPIPLAVKDRWRFACLQPGDDL
ncbi:MAG: hypothetical protein MUE50_17005, partial [Pirellulaceae bacterium]|nr:hypothetical protein [Pirellulaceae bacterium]